MQKSHQFCMSLPIYSVLTLIETENGSGLQNKINTDISVSFLTNTEQCLVTENKSQQGQPATTLYSKLRET